MDHVTGLTIAVAALGALLAIAAAAGKLSHRLRDRTVDRLYYLSYTLTGMGAALFIMRGLFGGRS
jgi:hypothetical protein